MARIKSKHVKRAMDNQAYDKVKKLLKGANSAEEVIARCTREAKRMGLQIKTKTSTSLKWSKMTTTFYKEIRLGQDFDQEPEWARAVIWAHEMVHVYQWRQMKRARFAARYLRAFWRWAIEIQAYRMSVMVRKRLGIEAVWNDRYIRQLPDRLRGGYALWRIRRSSLHEQTIKALRSEL